MTPALFGPASISAGLQRAILVSKISFSSIALVALLNPFIPSSLHHFAGETLKVILVIGRQGMPSAYFNRSKSLMRGIFKRLFVQKINALKSR